MLALCLMLLATYYALNYAGIIGRGLHGKIPALALNKCCKCNITTYNYCLFCIILAVNHVYECAVVRVVSCQHEVLS